MTIKTPTETVLIDGVTIRALLESVRDNRRGRLRLFLDDARNWRIFLSDNERFSDEFERTNTYSSSAIDYSSVKSSLVNLYNASAKYEECKYISTVRNFYKYIRCPFCGQGVCSTLDHYFDKDAYCELSLNIWNLIPSCGDCNFKKLNSKIESPTERFFHPFFDDFFRNGSEMNLYFIGIELFANPYMFTLNLQAGPELDASTKSIVNWHINKMEIGLRNGLIIRGEFKYWVSKVRKKRHILNEDKLVFEYLRCEYEDEISFSWRGAVLNSIISHDENFQKFYEVITNDLFSMSPVV